MQQHLQVEFYGHGGWWKDSRGRSGQVPQEQAKKGLLATVAILTNSYGKAGWDLTDVVSARNSGYRLSFERATDQHVLDESEQAPTRAVATHMG